MAAARVKKATPELIVTSWPLVRRRHRPNQAKDALPEFKEAGGLEKVLLVEDDAMVGQYVAAQAMNDEAVRVSR